MVSKRTRIGRLIRILPCKIGLAMAEIVKQQTLIEDTIFSVKVPVAGNPGTMT